MKTIVNTARADFYIGVRKKFQYSNSVSLYADICSNTVCGEVLCRPLCRGWQIRLVDKSSGYTVFCLEGKNSRSFCFEADSRCRYRLVFAADSLSVLRLYNTPDCVCETAYRETHSNSI